MHEGQNFCIREKNILILNKIHNKISRLINYKAISFFDRKSTIKLLIVNYLYYYKISPPYLLQTKIRMILFLILLTTSTQNALIP